MRGTLSVTMNPTHGDHLEIELHADGSEPTRVCILWHAPGAEFNRVLIQAMKKRGFAVTCVSSQHAVIAAACSLAKSAKRVVLVLDSRDELVGVDRVLDALERFSPTTICWEHQPQANPPMVPVVRTVIEQSKPEPDPQQAEQIVRSTRDTKPVDLRLVPEPVSQDANKPKALKPTGSGGTLRSSDVLNDDELNALLAGELGD